MPRRISVMERDWKPERGNSTRRRGDAEEDAENALRMGGRRVPGGGERVKGIRSAETAEDGSLRAGAEEAEQFGAAAGNEFQMFGNELAEDDQIVNGDVRASRSR